MYPKDRKKLDNFQGFVPVDFSSLPGEDEVVMRPNALDPFAQQVLAVTLELLKSEERVTIKDVLDVFEEKRIQTSDSVIRDRMSDLVDLGQLQCLPGAGRRPSYYSAPGNENRVEDFAHEQSADVLVEDDLADNSVMLSQLTEMAESATEKADRINQEIESKKAQLESLHKDIEAYQRVIHNLQGQSAKKSQEDA